MDEESRGEGGGPGEEARAQKHRRIQLAVMERAFREAELTMVNLERRDVLAALMSDPGAEHKKGAKVERLNSVGSMNSMNSVRNLGSSYP